MLTEQALVTVIIPVHNQIDYLKKCLDSLLNAKTLVSFDVLIIDDYSNPESARAIDEMQGFHLVRNFKNLGFLRSCNRAALNAKTRFILFLNSDTEVTDNWLDELVDTHNRFPDSGLVGSKLIYPDNSLQECGGIVWNDGSAWNYGRNADPNLPEYNYTKEVDYVSGAAIMIEKSFFLECGLFDQRYTPAYYEDTDLAFKTRSLGKKVYIEPKSVVIHHEGKSNGTETHSGIKKFQVENQKRFFNKWRHVLEKEHYQNAENLIRARDRTRDKKRILVIDHYVPTFDRDAGSRCMYMYLKLFTELGLSVTFFTDNFYRDPIYSPHVERLGIEILYGVRYRDDHENWLQENLNQFDYVFLSRPHISIKHIERIKKYSRAKTIYFGHDMHHVRLELEQKHNESITNEIIAKAKREEQTLWKICDLLLYPSSEETAILQNHGFGEKALEVPIFFYDENQIHEHLSFSESKGFLFVGNFNHPPNLDGIQWFINSIYPIITGKIGPTTLIIIGSSIPESILNLRSSSIIVESNLPDDQLISQFLSARVSIVPLRYGAGVKGKVLESLYYQTPLVTTDFGAQGIPNIGECSILANSSDTFADACIRLYQNETLWENSSKLSHEVLFKKYSNRQALMLLKNLFEK